METGKYNRRKIETIEKNWKGGEQEKLKSNKTRKSRKK